MKIKGFTLIELIVTLAILAVLAMIGTTSVSYLVQKNEQQILINEIKAAVEYAKAQAIILGQPVNLTPLDTSNWSKGVALTQLNKQTHKTELLYQWQWNHKSWSVIWLGTGLSKNITFSNNPLTAICNGKFVLANIRTKQHTEIILNRLGRVRVA